MTIGVDVEIAKLRADLVDDDAVTWTDADLLECLNEAVRASIDVRPDLNTVVEDVDLVAGTVQHLPPDGVQLFDVLENAATPFRVVTTCDQSLLDETYRFWPGSAQRAEVKHYTYDARDRLRFRVYPPNDGTGTVRIRYGALPPAMTLSDVLPINDQNEPAIYARAMGEAYRRNTERQDLGKTQGYFDQWGQLLGLSAQGSRTTAPKVNTSEGLS